jgi:CubicO group peptidase (beta-lactamase class C family)
MAAAISGPGGILASGVAGSRKFGDPAPLTDKDLWHIGSCTKAMTTALVATLVSQGTLRWESTLAEIFPEFVDQIHESYHGATIWQLLTHRSGVPANAKNWWAYRDQDLQERRISLLLANLSDAPTSSPGQYLYSNLGYMIAGCAVERLAQEPWESVIEKHLFTPLQMSTAGFGHPGNLNRVDQPWGHSVMNGAWNARQFDNPEALGPAGRIHCSIEDWAKFLALYLPDSPTSILDRDLIRKVSRPNGDYAGGWIVSHRDWAMGPTLSHSGSNTMWYATAWVAPKINRGYIVTMNCSSQDSRSLSNEMIGNLIRIDRENFDE